MVLVSIAFALVVEPFFGAILWGVIVAILFIPVNQGLLKLIPGHRNSAALLTLLLIIAIVIVPAIFLAFALVQEARVGLPCDIGVSGDEPAQRVGDECARRVEDVVAHWINRILQPSPTVSVARSSLRP